jgi:hypothetical protein
MGLVTMDDVACSAGPTKISTVSNFAWVASDLAKRKVEKTLKPLIQQLKNRAVYILKRLVDIVDKMVAVQKMKKSAHHGPASKLATSNCTSPPPPRSSLGLCGTPTRPLTHTHETLQLRYDPMRPACRGTTDTRPATPTRWS